MVFQTPIAEMAPLGFGVGIPGPRNFGATPQALKHIEVGTSILLSGIATCGLDDMETGFQYVWVGNGRILLPNVFLGS